MILCLIELTAIVFQYPTWHRDVIYTLPLVTSSSCSLTY